jgi:ABC-type branched-subunit amino acid transport system substrate-binding protein
MRTSSRLWRLLALLLTLSLLAAACGNDDDNDDAAVDPGDDTEEPGENGDDPEIDDEPIDVDFDTETLTIGTLLPETGDLAFLGPPMVEAVNMAVRDINDAGGVLGNDVVLETGDDGTDPGVANTTVDRLLGTVGVNAIIGAAASGITSQVVDKITGSGVVQCSPSNTAAALTDAGQDGYYFRTAPGDDLQGPTLAEVVLADGYSNIAVIVRADDYGVGFGDAIVETLEDGGATVVYNESYDPRATNFDAEVQAIAAENPDAVVLISFEEGVQIIQTMIEEGVGPAEVPLFIADGLASGDLAERIDPSDPGVAAGISGTAPSSVPEGGAAFFEDAFAEFAPGIDMIYSAQAYDCAVLIALAAEQAGSADPAEIRDNMESVSGPGGTECTTFAECKELIEAGEEIDYLGASGPVDFEGSDPTTASYDVFVYTEDGEQETIDQVIAN